jgi:predicted O-methyltransferase YrrM
MSSSGKSPRLGQMLFCLVEYIKPQFILELGTSLGITTCYLAKASSEARVYTLEGCGETAEIAGQLFKDLGISNISQITGNINDTLPSCISQMPRLDLVFFDANHAYQPTIHYFHICLSKATEESIFIFDDIHWSSEMQKAWEFIKNDPSVTLTLDLFYMGLVFFRKAQPKQHFILRI